MKHSRFWTRFAIAAALSLHVTPAFAGPEASTPLTYEMMAKALVKVKHSTFQEGLKRIQMKESAQEEPPAVFEEEFKKLEGKRVKVSGFAMPYDDPEKLLKFIMLKTVGGCFYCSPPDESEMLFIRLTAKEKPPIVDGEKLVVEGTLHLRKKESKDEEANQFLFTIDDAKLVPSKG